MDTNRTSTEFPSLLPPSLSNYTAEELFAVYHVIWVCYPILLALCTVGNVMSLVVLAHERHKGSTNAYMMAVAVSDLFVLWLYMPIYLYNFSKKIRGNPTFKKAFFEFYGMQKLGSDTFISLSDWTLLIFSFERLLAIVQPFRFRKLQTAKAARTLTILLFFPAALFYSYNAVAQYWPLTHDGHPLPAWLLHWKTVQLQAEVVVTISKFLALLVINALVVCALYRQRQSSVAKMRASQHRSSKRKYRNSNLLLLGSAALYLVTQLPALVINCLNIAADEYSAIIFPRSARQFAGPIVHVIFMLNYSVNFFLYLCVSERFRSQFVQVFGKRCFCFSTKLLQNRQDTVTGELDETEEGTSLTRH